MAIKIMIIEDDLIIAENLKENLIELGYEVTGVASRYKEAIELYTTNPPDLCLVDIYLKGSAKNGIETISDLNAGSHIPVIYLTSFSDLEYREKAKATNPSAYLMKPATKEQIDVSIDMAMSSFYKNLHAGFHFSQDLNNSQIGRKSYFFVKGNNGYLKIFVDEIVYLKADGTYCKIFTKENSYSISANLKNVLRQIETYPIERCHRSYAVNIHSIESFDDMSLFVFIKNEKVDVPLSNKYKKEILSKLPKIKTD